jgi:hypothetical protein
VENPALQPCAANGLEHVIKATRMALIRSRVAQSVISATHQTIDAQQTLLQKLIVLADPVAVLEWQATLPANDYEPRCPGCGAPVDQDWLCPACDRQA